MKIRFPEKVTKKNEMPTAIEHFQMVEWLSMAERLIVYSSIYPRPERESVLTRRHGCRAKYMLSYQTAIGF